MPVIPEGIYSETKMQRIGTMSTSRTQTIVDYYHCTQVDDNIVAVQILDIYGEPMPMKEEMPIDTFLKRFHYEPSKFKDNKVVLTNPLVDKAIANAENHVARKEYFSGEYEYGKALKLDEVNVRANFGLGKLYLEIGEVEKGIMVFSSLAQQDNVLEPENKHFFNELGIELRNLKLYEQAIDFYQKALGVAPDDENLMFNIARACREGGNKELALDYLNQALAINPELEAAKRLKKSL